MYTSRYISTEIEDDASSDMITQFSITSREFISGKLLDDYFMAKSTSAYTSAAGTLDGERCDFDHPAERILSIPLEMLPTGDAEVIYKVHKRIFIKETGRADAFAPDDTVKLTQRAYLITKDILLSVIKLLMAGVAYAHDADSIHLYIYLTDQVRSDEISPAGAPNTEYCVITDDRMGKKSATPVNVGFIPNEDDYKRLTQAEAGSLIDISYPRYEVNNISLIGDQSYFSLTTSLTAPNAYLVSTKGIVKIIVRYIPIIVQATPGIIYTRHDGGKAFVPSDWKEYSKNYRGLVDTSIRIYESDAKLHADPAFSSSPLPAGYTKLTDKGLIELITLLYSKDFTTRFMDALQKELQQSPNISLLRQLATTRNGFYAEWNLGAPLIHVRNELALT
jgi:hypothetical protein